MSMTLFNQSIIHFKRKSGRKYEFSPQSKLKIYVHNVSCYPELKGKVEENISSPQSKLKFHVHCMSTIIHLERKNVHISSPQLKLTIKYKQCSMSVEIMSTKFKIHFGNSILQPSPLRKMRSCVNISIKVKSKDELKYR